MNKLAVWSALAAVVLAAAVLPRGADAGATGQANTLRDLVPRYGGADEFDPEDEDYQMMVAVLAAIPVVLAALTLLVCLCFGLCRCCSCIGLCHCCVRPPREEGYSKRARWVPFIALAVFGGLVFAMATYGMTENDKLSDTLTAPAGSSPSFTNFIPRVFSGVRDKITELRTPILDILDQLQPTVDNATAVMNRSYGTISNGTQSLIDELNAFNATWANRVISTPLANYTCTYCTTVGTTMSDMATEIDAQTSGMITDMRDTIDDVTTTLTSEVDSIRDRISEINGTMDDAEDNVNDGEEQSDDIITYLNDYDPIRNQVTLYTYVVPLAGLALVLLGTLFKISCLFKINVWVYFLVTFVFWILLAVYLPLAVVLGDACVYVDQEQAKLPTKTDDFSKVAVSCLEGTSVLTALNVTDELDFAELIQFPTLPNVSEAFDFAALDQLDAQVSTLNLTTFGWNDTALTAPVDAINAAQGRSYAYVGFEDLDPDVEYGGGASSDKTDFINAQQQRRDGLASKQILNDTINAMVADVNSLRTTTTTLETNFGAAVDDIGQLELLIDPFIDIADLLISRAECAFLGDLYRELRSLTCVNISSHFAVLAMTAFIIAFSGWFIITFSVHMASRWARPYKDDWDDADKKGSQVEMQKVNVRPRGDLEKGTHHKH